MKLATIEKTDHLRDQYNNLKDIEINDVALTGIKENLVWNMLTNFHVTENLSIDSTHDVLEGICHYDLLAIFHQFIMVDKYFTLHQLNRRIEMFNFVPLAKTPLFNIVCIQN